ncbi:MAG: hypothetical protein HZA53_04150 [Planctomycetes bacterium]|nr:hypothetical protein [Planctomycetota bacterium]
MPEATSILVFAIVAGLLWYALARTGKDVSAVQAAGASPPEASASEVGRITTETGRAAVVTEKRP